MNTTQPVRTIHIHLVSDSTGETVCSVARAVLSQFEGVEAEEHVWPLIRTVGQVDKVLEAIAEKQGIVMYTIISDELKARLKLGCQKIGLPCIPVLSRVIAELSAYLGMKVSNQPGRQHELDEEYFSRVEAVNYTLAHDDGQATWDLEDADIVLVGVSRTSKSPTCMYLAHRGYRAANVPFVSGCPLPPNLEYLKNPIIVGLSLSPERLVQIRRSRLLSMKQEIETNYVDIEAVKAEITEAKRLFNKHGWPVIDATRRSVEEIAATIIQWYQERRDKLAEKQRREL